MISAPTVCPICQKRSHRGRKFWDNRMFCGETCLAIGMMQGKRTRQSLLDDILKKYYGPAIVKQMQQELPVLEAFDETIRFRGDTRQ